jgi:hypothetical protein
MAHDGDRQRLHILIDTITAQAERKEQIIQIHRGRTHYGRQTFVYYRVDLATLEMNTGNEPTFL